MELTYKHTKIYDWVGDDKLRTSIIKGIHEIENSKVLLKKCAYEAKISEILEWMCIDARYKDAEHPDGTDIEIKKGSETQFIFDGVRYAEMYKGTSAEAVGARDGIHLFINFKMGDTHQIKGIMIVPNWMVVKMTIPSKDIADAELKLFEARKAMNQGLNSQAKIRINRMIEAFNKM